jgi:hypothetical protein
MSEPIPAAIPAAPRPITPAATKMSWKETPVRVAGATAALSLVALAYLALAGVISGNAERAFDAAAVPAPATVLEIDGLTNQQARSRSDTMRVKLRAKVQGVDEPQVFEGYLPANTGKPPLSVGDRIEDLKVMPKDFRDFSDRAPRPWISHLWVPLSLLPAFGLFLALSVAQRKYILKLWQNGEAKQASVVADAARAPLAPGARILKLAHTDSSLGQRVFSVAYPDSLGVPKRGDTLDVIVDPKKPSRALAARAYV